MDGAEQQLQWAIQALAQPANIQPSLFPSYVMVPDELALEFDHWYEVGSRQFGSSWTREQRNSLDALNHMLIEMTASAQSEVWHGKQTLLHPQWAKVRHLADMALQVFGWPQGLPPGERAVYIQVDP